ncbi:MAG: ribosome biogenesis/translation initiation ATPase RLI [Nanoarchaeota archaeon]|nr:ribosome biogenesis/translation initiation ATPase RLI [Nanoarchaeota archaeon]
MVKRVAVLDKRKCKPKDCNYMCIRLCPPVRAGKEAIIKGEDEYPVINEEVCIGCGICVRKCPYNAIKIVNLPSELNKEPLHSYGKNSFRVYNFPIIKKGVVTGLLGPNAIGKTTIINILSNNFVPNLGGTEASAEEVIKNFRGTEVQTYFTNLYGKKLKVSVKPQHVDEIPKIFKGKVKELLLKTGNKNEVEKVSEKLGITHVLDSDVTKVSGGELQRIAIAATLLKKADVYVFDEPSSYLDVKQRLKVAGIIRELGENKTVLVVEHDLIMLDYMTDQIHLLYGEPGVYGIISQPYSTRIGINYYLEGFIKPENIRLRDKQIVFDVKTPEKILAKQDLFAWPELSKKYGKFSLKANPGRIKKSEIAGIIGENGIGKTAFAKLLAGVEKPSTGKLNKKIKISYKPQYIVPTSSETVRQVLKELKSESHETEIVRPLNLKPLFEKRVDQLSGGELQRVAIASCLSKEADIYLLDEPSAHLDVEQRIKLAQAIAKFVKNHGKSALIIDHDLLLLDYISDELMVFLGEPGMHGESLGPLAMDDGMNAFLKKIGLTFRRDDHSHRPRPNKHGSVKDREQKRSGKYYYQ